MLINNVKLEKSIEQKIKLRILYSIILLILGGVSLYVGTCIPLASGNADYSSGYYVGLGCGLIAAAIITIIKNLRLLKNKEALKQREIYESDERNRMIGLKCWSYAGYAMFILLYIALLFAGAVNVVFHPLINSTFWRAMYQQLFLLIHQCHQDCISNGTQSVLHLFLQNICRYDS